MNFETIGAVCFGLVLGWVTYRTLIRSADAVGLSDIATVLGVVGGAAVTGLFDNPTLFGAYCIGLAVGFFGYLIGFRVLNGPTTTGQRMGDNRQSATNRQDV